MGQLLDTVLPSLWSPHHRRMQNVEIAEKFHHNPGCFEAGHSSSAQACIPAPFLEGYTGLQPKHHGACKKLRENSERILLDSEALHEKFSKQWSCRLHQMEQ